MSGSTAVDDVTLMFLFFLPDAVNLLLQRCLRSLGLLGSSGKFVFRPDSLFQVQTLRRLRNALAYSGFYRLIPVKLFSSLFGSLQPRKEYQLLWLRVLVWLIEQSTDDCVYVLGVSTNDIIHQSSNRLKTVILRVF